MDFPVCLLKQLGFLTSCMIYLLQRISFLDRDHMHTSPLSLIPPNNTGSDTLNRYRYQAQLIVPFCLDCATNGKVLSITAEHFEDVLIEYEHDWHFIQVKTRNQELGAWKIGHAIDGLKSLLRTYQFLHPIKPIKASFSLMLEGAISKDDLLNDLVPGEDGKCIASSNRNSNLFNRLVNELEIDETACEEFLKNVVVLGNQPTRQDIAARNIRLLSQIAGTATSKEIEAGYERLVNRILQAMDGDVERDHLLEFITNRSIPSNYSNVQNKILTRDILRSLLGSLTEGSNLLLRRLVEPGRVQPTNLEMKLLAAGADQKIIKDAQLLRANASIREAEILAANYDVSHLDDVRNRLLVLNNSIVQQYLDTPQPATKAYHELLKTLMDNPESCDPGRIFRQDAYFLLGIVCSLADECLTDWGVPLA